ncbi:hypothetical protein KCP77_21905 [Salmonella enterica subsp. enterica]|nr:hypothetical protein KCP77_21905 [Salmonella enterica subsp. enterica]
MRLSPRSRECRAYCALACPLFAALVLLGVMAFALDKDADSPDWAYDPQRCYG